MTAARIDVPRLIRIVTLLLTVLALVLVYFSYAPQIDALHARIDDGQKELRSDEIAFGQATVLRGQRAQLARRYASLFAQTPQAVFVRELATTVHRHHVMLLATNVSQDAGPTEAGPDLPFTRTRVSIEMRGTYRALLAAIADLSNGSEIVEVREASLHRDGTAIAANVPVVIYEPLHPAQMSDTHAGATP